MIDESCRLEKFVPLSHTFFEGGHMACLYHVSGVAHILFQPSRGSPKRASCFQSREFDITMAQICVRNQMRVLGAMRIELSTTHPHVSCLVAAVPGSLLFTVVSRLKFI